VLAPRTISSGWSVTNQAFTTRVCGISDMGSTPTALDGFYQRSTGTCPTEITVTDAQVTVYTQGNFDIFYDGALASNGASVTDETATVVSNLPTVFDSVMVINQIM
jgi:hypothetical protein